MKILYLEFFLREISANFLITGGWNSLGSDITIIENTGKALFVDRNGLENVGARSYQKHCAVTFKGTPYLIGGGDLTKYRNRVVSYKNESWNNEENLPVGVTGHTCITHRDSIWVCGGKLNDSTSSDKCYHFNENKWSQYPLQMPYKSISPALASTRKGLYVFGGYNNGALRTVLLSTSGSNFRQLSSLPIPLAYSTAIVLTNDIYLFGGFDGVRQRREIYSLRPYSPKWRKIGDMRAPRSSHLVGIIPGANAVLIIGGHSRSNCEIVGFLQDSRIFYSECDFLTKTMQTRNNAAMCYVDNKMQFNI